MMKLSPQDALADAIASVQLAGLVVPKEMRAILERAAAGEISFATAKDIILECIHKTPYHGVDEF